MLTPEQSKRLRHHLLAAAATALLVSAPAIQAADNFRYDNPSYGSMVVDAAIARPLGLGATVVGAVAWIVTLPFSALGGNVREAGHELVVKPARFTFTRPLGEL